MTIDEAIRILGDTKICSPIGNAAFLAIQALKEQQERQRGCSMCNQEKKMGWNCTNEEHLQKVLDFDFCFNCGRKLEGEVDG